MENEVESRLRSILSSVLSVDAKELIPLFALNENWDSLAQMETILLIEEEFGIEFPVEKISSVENIKDLKEIIDGAVS